MAHTAHLTNSTILSPQATRSPHEVERSKTAQEKAEDNIYCLNHSLICLGVTDTVGLTLAANSANAIKGIFTGKKGDLRIDHDHDHGYGAYEWVRDRLTGKHKDKDYVHKIQHQEADRMKGGHCHHDHDHGHSHHHHDHHGHDHGPAKPHEPHAHSSAKPAKPHIHPDPAPKLTPNDGFGKMARKFLNTSKRWLAAEAVGDLGAVPFTVMLQRKAPGFMDGLRRNIIEPAIGGGFRANTRRAAENWGRAHGFDKNAPEVKERANELYEYEMRHMPQMVVWTVSSIGLNFAAMRLFHKLDPRQYEDMTIREFALVKGLGATMTAGLVLLVRGIIPGGAHKWDQTVGKHVIVPVMKTVGGLFGVKSEDVDRFQKQREELQSTSAPATAQPTPVLSVPSPAEKAEAVAAIPASPKTTVESASAEHQAPVTAPAINQTALAV